MTEQRPASSKLPRFPSSAWLTARLDLHLVSMIILASDQIYEPPLTVLGLIYGNNTSGGGADFMKSHFDVHRSYLLSIVSILLMVSQIVGSRVENVNSLWQASLLLGLGYGGIFGLLPTVKPRYIFTILIVPDD